MTLPCDHNDLPDVLKDAQAWVRKLTSGQVSVWEAQAFKHWRDTDPTHQAAFQEASRQWQLLKSVSGSVLDTNTQAALYHRKTLRQPRVGRRAFLGAAVGSTAAAGVAAYSPLGMWPAAQQWGADYHTAVGEQSEVTLNNRVTMVMNTRTSLRRISDQGRMVGVELLDGEAALEVRASPQAFRVVAGEGQVIAEAAGFEVRYLDGRTCVTCLHGKVSVEHPAGRRVLQARQLTRYDSGAISGIAAIEPDSLSPWRQGELVFKQTPLATVLEEINRYRPGRVLLLGDALRSKTVTARIKITEIETALLQIQYTFDLGARSFPAGVLVLS